MFYDIGVSAFPEGLKQEYNVSKGGGITFSWKEVERDQRNGLLLGYEIKLYYDQQVYTTEKIDTIPAFTILPHWKPEFCFPNAISVAAFNEVGVGNHCPPLNINLSG